MSQLRDEVLAQTTDPAEAWRLFRAGRRGSHHPLLRLTSHIDDAYRTDELEYLDRDDIPPDRRQHLLTALDRFHRRMGTYEELCRLLVPLVASYSRKRVLELASGHGQLAIALGRALAGKGISAHVEGSDLAPELVELAQRNAESAGSPATFRVLDATRIDAPDGSYDVAVNALMMHHLPFEMVVRVLREMRRVAHSAVLIDLYRSPLFYLPGGLLVLALSQSVGCLHDGMISMRKAWGIEEWRLAVALSGWERMRLGLSFPHLVVHLERDE